MTDSHGTLVRRRGLMLVMSSPSGAGKTSISRRVLELEPELSLSVSVTTRPRRPGEEDGVHYHFIDRESFDRMIAGEELLEHAEVYGNCYGTPRSAVEAALAAGRDVMFDIDWQGAQQLRATASRDVASLFILPPSVPELARRLRTRAQDAEDTVRYRLGQVASDVTHWAEYDYVLVNACFDESVERVRAILAAERLKRERQPGLNEFVAGFRNAGSYEP
ncbi:guanylate kinase [Marinimicrococcus flavescens]|uniref:Guanylate kinase n=1 Tax=Marinimicrococcus flavescens TaxID=3031815 RepID=A0AAP3V0W4_9PROT|nr:guanylate kinase [Marinimicrococcus flavescens]